MAYLALYRRFRPQGFEGLIGQEHIAKILKNQIDSGKIGHAYLFCGARGTGKTTVAKVFARAINCLNPVNGSPCGKCEVCVGLKDPSNMDILEMDAASNNGVDDIREMRDKIQYPPVVGKYKVYIVDEVHMLSPAAFNALLKTLEEPPAHAVFIFATTEVHKIPQTILSRCMRFDFKLISQPELAGLIKRIFDEIGKEYEEEAVDAIARAGEGSARDSLSIADMCSSYSTGKLTYADVLEVLGATDKGKVLDLVKSIIASDTGSALGIINELASLGKNMGVLADDVAGVLRDLTICNTAKNPNEILSLPAARFEQYMEVANGCDGHRLLRLIEIFTSLDNAFRYTTHPRIVLETAVVKACRPDKDYDMEALLSRIATLENAVKEGVKVKVESGGNTAQKQIASDTEKVVKPESVKKAEIPVQREIQVDVEEKAPDIPQKQQDLQEDDGSDDIGALPDFDFFTPPPELDGAFMGVAQMPPVKEVKPLTEEKEILPPAKVWGNVLRTLRSNGNAVLWTVCQDVIGRADSNGVLTITVSSDSEYDMFNRGDHIKTITEAANKFGDYTVKVVRRVAVSEDKDEFARDIEEIKRTFGEDVVKIINND